LFCLVLSGYTTSSVPRTKRNNRMRVQTFMLYSLHDS
jgi:hypothetical protein